MTDTNKERAGRFTKKPVTVDAVQYTEAVRDAYLFDGTPLPAGVYIPSRTLHPPTRTVRSADAYIDTLEGRMNVAVGDWVITGVKGERYPCKPDIFEATYERASLSAEAEPTAWGIFDSQGFYEAATDQESAERFCAHYNKRKGADPLKPYTAKPLYLAAPAQAPAPGHSAKDLKKLRKALIRAQQAINSMKVEAETAAQGDKRMMLEACETISNEGLQADMAIREALAAPSSGKGG